MIPKKSGGKVIGAHFTNAEQKAIDLEVGRQMAEWNNNNLTEIDAILVYWLMSEKGLSKEELHEFYIHLRKELDELNKRYELGDSENPWIMRQKLLDAGIDLDEWAREVE